jgi:hypothetical protein
MDVEITIGGFVRGKSTPNSKTEENKDKDGKVISKTTTYWVSATNSGTGYVKVYGTKNELPVVLTKKQLEKQKEKEEKEAKKKDKKAEEIAENPFLKNVDVAPVVEEVEEQKSTKNLIYTYSLNYNYEYSTGKHSSASQASKEFSANYISQANSHEQSFRNDYPSWTNAYLNKIYGYRPYNHYAKFKKLDSKKHPEFSMFDNATTAMKLILEKMRYNKPIAEIEKDLTPIISYFESVVKKYSNDDKQEKRLKHAAQYNMARIFQFLDRLDKVIEIGNMMIADDFDKKDGERFVEESTELKRKLAFHNMNSRHITPRNAAEEKEEEGEKGSETEEDGE